MKTNTMPEAQAFVPGKSFKPKAKAVNPKTAEEAIKMCIPMVVKCAHKWTRNHRNYFQDFVSEGHCGVLEAWKRFHNTDYESKGYRFTSYAFMWIRVYQRDFALRMWNFKNNTQEANELNMDNETYELSIDYVSAKVEFDKLGPMEQQLVLMKSAGETFESIAEVLGFDSLHKARTTYLKVCERLGA